MNCYLCVIVFLAYICVHYESKINSNNSLAWEKLEHHIWINGTTVSIALIENVHRRRMRLFDWPLRKFTEVETVVMMGNSRSWFFILNYTFVYVWANKISYSVENQFRFWIKISWKCQRCGNIEFQQTILTISDNFVSV